jgi:hypothetical protein
MMADHLFVEIKASDVRHRIEEIFLEHLDELADAYLQTLADDDGGEVYGSWREIAATELRGFISWLKMQVEQCNE